MSDTVPTVHTDRRQLNNWLHLTMHLTMHRTVGLMDYRANGLQSGLWVRYSPLV